MAGAYAYDSAWRNLTGIYAYDGSAWREITTGYVYDGTTWREFWSASCTATLDSATQKIGSDGSGCSAGKCVRCIEWTTTDAPDADFHIRILRSVSGGSYFERADDQSIERRCASLDTCGDSGCTAGTVSDGKGCYCDAGCQADGISTNFKVRLEADGGDTLACGDSGNEIITGALSSCGGGGGGA